MQHSNTAGCILLKFYIKPQLPERDRSRTPVVSYRNSTSNHNSTVPAVDSSLVVSYRNSTSNHNLLREFVNRWRVVSYRNSTSNHNSSVTHLNTLFVVSYRNSTSNHNWKSFIVCSRVLYLIEILHQTTTFLLLLCAVLRCILSKFYIKPQLYSIAWPASWCCILSKFYIKPQRRGDYFFARARCILSKFYIKPQPFWH